jgi:exodeoxyribonuclease V gamma subunit
MSQTNLKLFASNRFEILAKQLAGVVQTPLPTPFTPEIIVVQSRGMERWISMELARLNGISANCFFPFPNAFLENIFKELIPNLPDVSPFDPEIMTFRLMKIIPQCAGQKGFENLQAYLVEDGNHLKLYQLAGRIADLFDQYQVFRPQLLFRWEQSKEEKKPPDVWQAGLWRELSRGYERLHRARLRETLLKQIRDLRLDPARLPARVSLFGISHLPLFHLQTFAELSRLIEVNLFLIEPCREYWADIMSEREVKKIRRKNPQVAENIEWYHFEKGNRLLANMGTLGRDFLKLISDLDCDIFEQFAEPQEHSMLSCLQSDILNLRDREFNMNTGPPGLPSDIDHISGSQSEIFQLSEHDTSVQVHSCHSPMREIEVLHDNLLAMFEEDSDLMPKDIIVMTPDIEKYAPYIHAVFDSQTDKSLRIPYSVADQSPRTESRMIEGFLALFDINDGRFGAVQVLSLLEYPGMKERFDLAESDIELIERWVTDTQIRWGIDADSRLDAGLSGFTENTWQSGLQRLILGYAMPGLQHHMFNGILPYDNIEGGDAQTLGNFLSFIERLISWSKKLAQPQTLRSWQMTLAALVDRFFKLDENQERQLQVLRNFLDNLADIENKADFHDDVQPAVIKSYLKSRLDQNRYGSGFLTGGITFCAMLPMRSIPFKIICLIGMGNDAYPRDFQPLNFDLIARHPQPGDRSRRNDDKYLFLESILSARQTLYISYVGQSIQDNSILPPSVLVSELLDTIEKSFVGLDQRNPLEKIVTKHRLQAFSSWYFRGGTGLFSYSIDNMLASRSEKADPPTFFETRIPQSPEEVAQGQKLELDSLCRFFSNPTRFFIQRRLGFFLADNISMLEDRENFVLIALEKYLVEQNLLKARLSGSDLVDFKPIQKALGQLPHGHVGDFSYNEMSVEVEGFVKKIERFTSAAPMDSLEIDVQLAGFDLRGRVPDITESGWVNIRYARKNVKNILSSWIYHLVLCHEAPPEYPRTSFLISKNSAIQFGPVPESKALIETLLNLFRSGLEEPIHFFPESSHEYAQQKLIKSLSDQAALAKAGQKWRGGNPPRKFTKAESDDRYYDLCFRRMDPLDDGFRKIALLVFTPIIANSKEIIL